MNTPTAAEIEARALAAIEADPDTRLGICIRCGAEREGCEPDAARYGCRECRHRTVWHPEEILLRSATTAGAITDRQAQQIAARARTIYADRQPDPAVGGYEDAYQAAEEAATEAGIPEADRHELAADMAHHLEGTA